MKAISSRKKLAVTSLMISIVASALLVAIASVGVASSAFSTSSAGAVYTIDNSATGNNVLVYTRAPDGTLTAAGSVPANGLGTGAGLGSQGAVVLTQNGKWLLVVDAGSNEISVFAVQGNTLTFVSKAGSQGGDPISLTVNRDLVYVLDAAGNGNIAGFTLSSAGTLSYIPGSTQPLSGATAPSPEQIGFSTDGRVLVVTEKASNTIDTYVVSYSSGAAGAPNTFPSNGVGPYGFAFTEDGQLILSEAASNSLSSYVLSDSGQLRTISGAMPTFGNAPCWVVVRPDGQFAYTTNAHGGTISSFSISRAGGLTLFSSVATHTAIPALDMDFSQGSQFLYVRNSASITGFRVFDDGSILSLGSVSGLPAATTGLAAS